MKKVNLCGLAAAMMLLAFGCSKKELPVKTDVSLNSPKKITGVPPGFMTGTLPTGTYRFISIGSTVGAEINKAIGIAGDATTSGALAEMHNIANTSQQWRITQTGFGTYSVINYKSGMSLDNKNGAVVDNNPIWQYPYDGNAAQLWIIEYQGLNVYRIKSLQNTNWGLHVAGGSTAAGTDLVLKQFAGGATQQWAYFYAYSLPISASPATVHTFEAGKTDTYPRVVQLPSGNLIASFTTFTTSGWLLSTTKFYKSTNQGVTWTSVGTLSDTRVDTQGYFDPELFVMPVTQGTTTAGSLICGVRSGIFFGKSYIDVYKSTNEGTSWTFLSTVAEGNGEYTPPGGGQTYYHNVYEPHFSIDNSGKMVCFYSDASHVSGANDDQRIVAKTSTNGGVNWSAVIPIIQLAGKRPGMLRVAKMGNNKWIGVYEYVGYPGFAAVHRKMSDDGLNFGTVTDPGVPVTTIDGFTHGTSPSVIYTPMPGSTTGVGTVLVSGAYPTSGGTFNVTNTTNGTGNWYKVPSPLPYDFLDTKSGYSRCVGKSNDGKTLYHITCVKIGTDAGASTRFASSPAW